MSRKGHLEGKTSVTMWSREARKRDLLTWILQLKPTASAKGAAGQEKMHLNKSRSIFLNMQHLQLTIRVQQTIKLLIIVNDTI